MASLALRDVVFRAAAAGSGNRNGLSYAVASKGSPEMLTMARTALGRAWAAWNCPTGWAWPYLTYVEPCHRIGLT